MGACSFAWWMQVGARVVGRARAPFAKVGETRRTFDADGGSLDVGMKAIEKSEDLRRADIIA